MRSCSMTALAATPPAAPAIRAPQPPRVGAIASRDIIARVFIFISYTLPIAYLFAASGSSRPPSYHTKRKIVRTNAAADNLGSCKRILPHGFYTRVALVLERLGRGQTATWPPKSRTLEVKEQDATWISSRSSCFPRANKIALIVRGMCGIADIEIPRATFHRHSHSFRT